MSDILGQRNGLFRVSTRDWVDGASSATEFAWTQDPHVAEHPPSDVHHAIREQHRTFGL